MISQFTLSLLDYDGGDPLAGFFGARATVASGDSTGETTFTLAGRDLEAFVAAAARIPHTAGASALLLGGWEAERALRLEVESATLSDAIVARVSIVSQPEETDLPGRVETEFVATPGALAAFLSDIQHLVERRGPGDATLNGDADADA